MMKSFSPGSSGRPDSVNNVDILQCYYMSSNKNAIHGRCCIFLPKMYLRVTGRACELLPIGCHRNAPHGKKLLVRGPLLVHFIGREGQVQREVLRRRHAGPHGDS